MPNRPAVIAPAIYLAGQASTVITPPKPMWMGGYAFRDHPAEATLGDLYVKALVLEDAAGRRLALVTCDLIAVGGGLTQEVARALNLPPECLRLAVSHTHSGPAVCGPLEDMYRMPGPQATLMRDYSASLGGRVADTVKNALDDLRPATLAVGETAAPFAVNRRQTTPGGIILGVNPQGPTDRSVPVLRVADPEGDLRAVVFGYACHTNTLNLYQWSGDYAGEAQTRLQASHPGALAMFWCGCAGDINPHPRGTVELCRQHGEQLAQAVEGVLAGEMTSLTGPFQAFHRELALPLQDLPGQLQAARQLLSRDYVKRRLARRLLRQGIPPAVAYPVQLWRLGDGPWWVALGGEPVVDFALRLKRALGPSTWITGYANDVMAYIPSGRILQEGGYEADISMAYYGLPGRFTAEAEERIVKAVQTIVQSAK